jgi:hypothetical protein
MEARFPLGVSSYFLARKISRKRAASGAAGRQRRQDHVKIPKTVGFHVRSGAAGAIWRAEPPPGRDGPFQESKVNHAQAETHQTGSHHRRCQHSRPVHRRGNLRGRLRRAREQRRDPGLLRLGRKPQGAASWPDGLPEGLDRAELEPDRSAGTTRTSRGNRTSRTNRTGRGDRGNWGDRASRSARSARSNPDANPYANPPPGRRDAALAGRPSAGEACRPTRRVVNGGGGVELPTFEVKPS